MWTFNQVTNMFHLIFFVVWGLFWSLNYWHCTLCILTNTWNWYGSWHDIRTIANDCNYIGRDCVQGEVVAVVESIWTCPKILYGFNGECQRERVGEMVSQSHFWGTWSPLPFYLFNITFHVVFIVKILMLHLLNSIIRIRLCDNNENIEKGI